MTATYSGDPSLSNLDYIRFRLGDTDMDHPLLSNAEIMAGIQLEDDRTGALVFLARGLIARYSREPVLVETDGARFDFRERIQSWRDLVGTFGTEAGGQGLRIRRLSQPSSLRSSEYS